MEHYEIAAITDLIPERCQETKQEFPDCKVYPDYHAMLQDKSLELIVNASFSEQHVPISIEALEAGFHVLSEKPLATNLEDCKKIGQDYSRDSDGCVGTYRLPEKNPQEGWSRKTSVWEAGESYREEEKGT